MFDFVRQHNRLFQFLLMLLILPSFAFVGMQSYTSMIGGANTAVAMVDGRKITQGEWDQAHKEQTNRVRQQSPDVDPKLLDSPRAKYQALEGLVSERVLEAAAAAQHFAPSEQRITDIFWRDPQFEFLRNPDGTVNQTVLAAQGMSPGMLKQRLSKQLALQQVTQGVETSAFGGAAAAKIAFDALLQQREVQVQRFDPQEFAAKLSPTEAELDAYYKDAANAAQFQLPEQAQIQYVALDLEALKKDVSFTEENLRSYYAENANRYGVPEERRASHILIKAERSDPKDVRDKAKARAAELLAQVRKVPGSFADVAKKNSQDEGSAKSGGDLDFFSRGAMVKEFDAAVYAMKSGEISDLVETDFGFHIIQLTAVRGGDKKPFEAVRAEVEAEVRKQLAQRKYAEAAEQFGNLAYEQSDSLQPVADKLKLQVQTATVLRQPAAGASGPLASTKLLDAVFGADALRNKRNTEAVETGASQLVSARVVQHLPARVPPFAEIQAKVREAWVRKAAQAQARKLGQERLAALKGGAAADGLSAAKLVSRAQPQDLTRKALEAVLAADATKLPAWIGVETEDGGYLVARIGAVQARDEKVIDAQRAGQQFAAVWSRAEGAAFMNALKAHYKASIKVPAPAASDPTGSSGG